MSEVVHSGLLGGWVGRNPNFGRSAPAFIEADFASNQGLLLLTPLCSDSNVFDVLEVTS